MKKENVKTLEDAFKWIEKLDTPDIDEWLALDEDKALAYAHHGFGMMVRNELGLWHKGSIVPYFHGLGIYHADDMSGIILTSFHRKENGKDLDIDTQVKKYIKHWEKHDPKVNQGKYVND